MSSLTSSRVPLHVVSTIQRGYLTPLAVMVASAAERLGSGYRLVLHLVSEGLRAEDWEALRGLVEVVAVEVPAGIREQIPANPRYPAVVALPLALGELLDETLGRVLYLDADLLVCADLGELWESELGGAVVGAVQDMAVPYCGSARGVREIAVPRGAPYFNAGVMVLEPGRWRRERVFERGVEYLRRHGPGDFYQQETFNALLHGQWKALEEKWNAVAAVAQHGGRMPEGAAIVHFAGRFKPWRMKTGGQYGDWYQEQLEALRERAPGLVTGEIENGMWSHYERYARPVMYPLERWAWARRWI